MKRRWGELLATNKCFPLKGSETKRATFLTLIPSKPQPGTVC